MPTKRRVSAGRVPFHAGWIVFDKIGEGGVSPLRLGKRPPNPVFPHLRGSAVERRPQSPRMPKRRCRALHQRGGNFHVAVDADHEQARSRVGNEQRRVDHDRAKNISGLLKIRTDRGEVLAFVRGQRTAYIFERDDARRPSLGDQVFH